MNTLASIIQRRDKEAQELADLPRVDFDNDDDDILTGKITETMRNNNSFEQLAGFSEGVIASITEIVTPLAMQARTRGPLPKSSVSDMILCYLLTFRTDLDVPKLAKIFNLSEERFSKNVERIRPLLNAAMKNRWVNLLPRPDSDLHRRFNYAGLLVDATTIQCFRPEGRFEEAKHYYDGKNHIYGLKVEVAVTTCAPHYFVRSSPHVPASVHDYTVNKKEYLNYVDYLRKRPGESDRIHDPNPNEPNWATVNDKAYIGPATDTPGVRRITPTKNPLTLAQRQANQQVNEDRTPIEQFFGRLCKKFPVYRNTYRYDHKNFDVDFQIACFLVNEDILLTALAKNDIDVYNGVLSKRQKDYDDEKEKESAARQRYQATKRQRVDSFGQYVPGNKKD
ncbi:MAG TPA: transposase family protein [Fusibacter sp.]|nr:transposase family protein [Fusibacter sp.]